MEAVERCNRFDVADFPPVVVGRQQIGWANEAMLDALAPHLAIGHTCELVEGSDTSAVRLAPRAQTEARRTELVRSLVEGLVDDEYIPRGKVRGELQWAHAFSASGSATGAPLLRMERAAMIYFGIPSSGVHINGWVRDPSSADPRDATPWAMWVAKRSLSKPTYPGLLDQMAAGGVAAGDSIDRTARKEAEEEASLPPDALDRLTRTGLVSYRYATRKGLSTKVLYTYDLEVPHGLLPLCADGEVDEFRLVPIAEVLRSLREELPLWKPNSALVAIDFCVRHGLIDDTEPSYLELVHGLRRGGDAVYVAV